ncbi:MAG: hypothetical protein JW720_04940 [Sedimentisphaerales bacterium]|nr:hypothetical protein [Sedimentisphaerales bacterium]
MKRLLYVVLVAAFAVALVSAAGCQESQTPGDKKARLIAAENMELKKQIAQKDKEIEGLKTQYTVRLKLEQSKLAECRQKTADCQQELKEGMEKTVNDVLVAALEESAKIREENATLKEEIAKLKGEAAGPEEAGKTE